MSILKRYNGSTFEAVGVEEFDDLSSPPKYNGSNMTHSTDIPQVKTEDWDGKYSKPASGIPSTDMTQAVQSSLALADSALQSVPNTYRTASAQDTIDAGKQAQNIQRTVTISVDDWSGGTTCVKTVTGVTASNTVIVDSSDATVSATAQGTDELTFTATATPSAVVTVKVVILP